MKGVPEPNVELLHGPQSNEKRTCSSFPILSCDKTLRPRAVPCSSTTLNVPFGRIVDWAESCLCGPESSVFFSLRRRIGR